MLADLAKVCLPAEEMDKYVSITAVQTQGLKRQLGKSNARNFRPKEEREAESDEDNVTNAMEGSKKRRLTLLRRNDDQAADPNVVGLNFSGSESDSSEKSVCPARSENIEKAMEKSAAPPRQKTVSANREATVYVNVDRNPEIQEARLKLPVLAEEQIIVEAINDNPVVIITGETGSGKTTQVPQFLYEAGYAKSRMIGITEPRRVAAMSMSKRIAREMNLSCDIVSYVIRFEGNATADTKIKFMTDGVLLKEIQTDFLLNKYSVIILDEAHERTVYTDILIGLLSRIVPLRGKRNDPLKLVIMSATLRVQDFIDNPRLFKIRPPVIAVESRQFPVTIHFNRRTSDNYILEALRKTAKIHARLPKGGILVFVTGQHEVNTMVRRLRKAFPYRRKKWDMGGESSEDQDEHDDTLRCRKKKERKRKRALPIVNLDDYSAIPSVDAREDFCDVDDEDGGLGDDDDDDDDEDILDSTSSSNCRQPLWVLPLYSLLPAVEQARVFEPIPDGCRLCVVSTNVAETSLTIPNVNYIVDSGRTKMRVYDKVTGVSTYRICWASQAAANQRAGRSGRNGPGHCYRLYSSAVFNDEFEKFTEPEIRRKPVDDLILRMKLMNIDKVVNFPFPSPPDSLQLKSAERRLRILGALEENPLHKSDNFSSKITPLGRSIGAFPVAPRYGKMLAISQQSNLLKYTICMVAALSVEEILVESPANTKWLQTRRFWAGTGDSLLLGDPMVLLGAVGAAEYAGSTGKMENFCAEHGLRSKAIIEIRKLRRQLTNDILLNIPDLKIAIDPSMSPPTNEQAKLLRQLILAGMGDRVARKLSPDEIKKHAENSDKSIKWKHAYKTLEIEEPVFMHSSSVLRRSSPEWIVYQEIYETNKMYMRGVTAIEPEWLPKFVPSLCNMSPSRVGSPPRYDRRSGRVLCHMSPTFGAQSWQLADVELEHPKNIDGIKIFARAFLEGNVAPELERFVPFLLSPPSSVCAHWANLLPMVESLVKALLSRGVMSRDKLIESWHEDRRYLLEAYKKWLPESAHSQVALAWPPSIPTTHYSP